MAPSKLMILPSQTKSKNKTSEKIETGSMKLKPSFAIICLPGVTDLKVVS
jgi:hypothetical protein